MAIRKLTDPEIKEVSLVDIGANLRPFFFVKNLKSDLSGNLNEDDGSINSSPCTFSKADADIKIESNGTVEGTTIKINGKDISPIDFNFNMYSYEWGGDVNCNFSIEEKAEKGEFSQNKVYSLQKSLTGTDEQSEKEVDEIKKSVSTIQGFLKDEKLDHMGEDEIANLAKCLDVLADYKDLVPPDASEAIEVLTSIAVLKSNKQDEVNIEIEKKEEEMTEQKEEKKEEKGTEVKVEDPVKVEEPVEAKETPKPAVNLMNKEDLEKLEASIVDKVTTNVTDKISAMLDEKFKDEDDEEIEVTEEDLMALVDNAING